MENTWKNIMMAANSYSEADSVGNVQGCKWDWKEFIKLLKNNGKI